ncbi:MAG: class I SAM-dependent methyltransferase [Acidimicrobiales bacterium]
MPDDAALLPFSAHNVALPNGERTIPGEILLEERPYPRAVMRSLELLFPAGGRGEERPTIVDLGCLEGGFTSLFAQAGFDALGIEGREENVARCELVAGRLGLPNLRFACDDVRNLESYGIFDVVFCSGLLYHLDFPVDFLELVGRVAKRALVLHTHVAGDMIPPKFPNLSELATHEGVVGRWYPEHAEGQSEEEMMASRWASIGNRRSFWIEKRHLVEVLRRVGFSTVYEQHDFLSNVVDDNYVEDYGACLLVAVRG